MILFDSASQKRYYLDQRVLFIIQTCEITELGLSNYSLIRRLFSHAVSSTLTLLSHSLSK
jgi:hypothetical protein